MVLLTLALGCLTGPPDDLAAIERVIPKEPANPSADRRYCLLVFGRRADHGVWVVHDGATLHIDRDGNGDLTDAGETTAMVNNFAASTILRPEGKVSEQVIFSAETPAPGAGVDPKRAKPAARVTRISVSWRNRWFGAWGDETGDIGWGKTPAAAPILHIDGPLRMGFEVPAESALEPLGPGEYELNTGVGTRGLGRGSFVHLRYTLGAIPEGVFPTATVDFPNSTPGGPPIRVNAVLKRRCLSCILHDTVRVDGAAKTGAVTIRLAFDAWKEGRVAPATFTLPLFVKKSPAPP